MATSRGARRPARGVAEEALPLVLVKATTHHGAGVPDLAESIQFVDG